MDHVYAIWDHYLTVGDMVGWAIGWYILGPAACKCIDFAWELAYGTR